MPLFLPEAGFNLTLFKFFKIEQGYNLAALEEDLNKSQSADIKEKALKAAAESPASVPLRNILRITNQAAFKSLFSKDLKAKTRLSTIIIIQGTRYRVSKRPSIIS